MNNNSKGAHNNTIVLQIEYWATKELDLYSKLLLHHVWTQEDNRTPSFISCLTHQIGSGILALTATPCCLQTTDHLCLSFYLLCFLLAMGRLPRRFLFNLLAHRVRSPKPECVGSPKAFFFFFLSKFNPAWMNRPEWRGGHSRSAQRGPRSAAHTHFHTRRHGLRCVCVRQRGEEPAWKHGWSDGDAFRLSSLNASLLPVVSSHALHKWEQQAAVPQPSIPPNYRLWSPFSKWLKMTIHLSKPELKNPNIYIVNKPIFALKIYRFIHKLQLLKHSKVKNKAVHRQSHLPLPLI